MKPYRRKDSPVWDVSHASGTHRIMRSTGIADYSEARRIADDFGVGVPEDAGCGGIGGAPLDKGVGVPPLDNYVVTTKRVLINYALRHVMTDANPSGAVAPPPLAGEAFPVVKT